MAQTLDSPHTPGYTLRQARGMVHAQVMHGEPGACLLGHMGVD